jgi:hypothetical protein
MNNKFLNTIELMDVQSLKKSQQKNLRKSYKTHNTSNFDFTLGSSNTSSITIIT